LQSIDQIFAFNEGYGTSLWHTRRGWSPKLTTTKFSGAKCVSISWTVQAWITSVIDRRTDRTTVSDPR